MMASRELLAVSTWSDRRCMSVVRLSSEVSKFEFSFHVRESSHQNVGIE